MIVNVYSKLKSDLIVVDILDKNNRPVDGVESDKKDGNDNFARRFHLEKEKMVSTVSTSPCKGPVMVATVLECC